MPERIIGCKLIEILVGGSKTVKIGYLKEGEDIIQEGGGVTNECSVSCVGVVSDVGVGVVGDEKFPVTLGLGRADGVTASRRFF